MKRVVLCVLAFALVVGACSGDDDDDDATDASTSTEADGATSTTAPEPAAPIVFNGQGNDLAAYETEPPFTKQIVIHHQDDEHADGLDINAQICFDPQNPRRFVAGEDTEQTTTGEPGWGIFELEGDTVGDLAATQVGKLVPTYQPSTDNPENYGCGFLSDGRIITTDVGNQADGPADGQLIVWFPPFESREVAYCKLDVTLATGQSALVDGDALYVAQARGAGVRRFDVNTFPTSNRPEDGCDATDATDAPMATGVTSTPFIQPDDANGVATSAGIAKSSAGGFYVSSVFTGVISEFGADGSFIRRVLEPPAGETLGAEPYSTGTPLGLGVAPDGSLFYADIGITVSDGGVGPGDGTGKVRRIAFVDGEPQPPEVMDQGLAFPDGIGIWINEG